MRYSNHHGARARCFHWNVLAWTRLGSLDKSNRINSQVILVGIGSVQSANTFARDIGLMDDPLYRDRITLVTDETGRITEALQCYRGWLTVDPKHRERYPQTDMDPSLKLLGMIIGLGSPGTIPSVIEGYTGDVSQKYGPFGRRWVVQALRQGNDKGRFPRVQVAVDDGGPKKVLRPFELATLRLQTGLHIVSRWSKLGPKDGELFTRMGGTFIFSGTECIWEHFDRGILNFANMDDICQVADAAAQGGRYVPPTNIRSAQESRQRFWATKDEEAKRRDEEEVRLAEEARLVRERQAEEARLADEARLEELDRIEQARITEMALQGQEAKRKRLEEEERNAQKTLMIEEADRAGADEAKRASEAAAKKVAEEEKASIEATEQEEAAKTSLEAPTMLASEQEAADRIACDEAQMIKVQEEMVGAEEAHGMEAKVDDETVVVETAEDSAARVIAAVSDVEPDAETAASEQSGFTDERTESLDPLDAAILKAEEQEKNLWASLEALKSAPRSDAESSTKEEDKSGKDQREAFQRRMLAARIHYESALTEVAPDGEAAASEVAGTANILSGRKTKTASAPQESFQRSLLKARLQYEAATRLAEVKSDMKHEYSVFASYDDGEISVGVEPDGTVNDDIVESEAPRSHNGVELQKEQDKFQRNLLSARLHYEQSTPSHSKSTEDEENENEESPSSEFFALSPDEAFS